MSALDQLEAFLQGLLERPLGRFLPRSMQPIQLAGALTKALENGQIRLSDRIVIPNTYQLLLAVEDFERLLPAKQVLERELAEYVERLAAERELSLPADPAVEIRSSTNVWPGHIRAEAFPVPQLAASPTASTRIPTSMGATLSLIAPNGSDIRRYPLLAPSVTLGRRSSNDVALPDLKVSRYHARIESRGTFWSLVDLTSRNGTRLNGRPVSGERHLSSGDIIEVGLSRLRFNAGPISEERRN
jgi:hypothetical protein